MSFHENELEYEMIIVLKDRAKSDKTFIETQYLPWVLEYGQKITELYNKQKPNAPVKNLFSKSKESMVAGHRVFGIKGEIPLYSSVESGLEKIGFNLRITTADNFMLTASTDNQLERLIQIAQTLQRKSDSGPLMKADIDMGDYLESVKTMLPQNVSESDVTMPRLGRIIYSMDLTDGRLIGQYTISLEDIKSMMSFYQQQGTKQPGAVSERGYGSEFYSPTSMQGEYTKVQKAPLDENSAQYWINKGLLYSTYGSDPEAIKCFMKSIDLDPSISSAYFNLGLSYAGQGEHKKAIDALNQAIDLKPDNGDYFYGRGWVYLRDGNQDAAMNDFQKADDLGSSDARRYLQKISR